MPDLAIQIGAAAWLQRLRMTKSLSPAREFGFLLSDVARILRTTVDHEARAIGMTRAQWSVLVRVQRQEGLHQADLAALLDLAPITLARIVDRLDAMGLVERRPDPEDRRANRLYLTTTAGPVLTRLGTIGERIMQNAVKGFDQDMLATLIQQLVHVQSNLKSYQKARNNAEQKP